MEKMSPQTGKKEVQVEGNVCVLSVSLRVDPYGRQTEVAPPKPSISSPRPLPGLLADRACRKLPRHHVGVASLRRFSARGLFYFSSPRVRLQVLLGQQVAPNPRSSNKCIHAATIS